MSNLKYYIALAEFFNSKNFFFESLNDQRSRAKRNPPTCRIVNKRKVVELPWQLLHCQRWDDIENLFVDHIFLEAKTEAGMVYELANDFNEVVNSMPTTHQQYHVFRLLKEAILRDAHFLWLHPTSLFQCLWNSCWWYDCPERLKHYKPSENNSQVPLLLRPALAPLMESWRTHKRMEAPGFRWVRSLRPPPFYIGGGQKSVLRGHEDEVTCVVISPLTNRIVSSSRDKTVRIWEMHTGKQINCLVGHTDSVMGVACSFNEKYIASVSLDRTIRIWDFISGRQANILNHNDNLRCAAFTPLNDSVIFGGNDKMIHIWKINGSNILISLSGHRNIVTSLSVSPDGKLLASGSLDSTVRIWNLSDGKQIHCLNNPTISGIGVNSVAFSPDSRSIISGEWGWLMRIWDVESGKEIKVVSGPDTYVGGRSYLEGHNKEVMSVSFAPDNNKFVSGSWDKSVRVWDSSNGRQLLCFFGHENSVNSVCFSSDGDSIISGGADKTIRIWETNFLKNKRFLNADQYKLLSITFSPDGQKVVAGSLNFVQETERYHDTEVPEMVPSDQVARYVFDAHTGEYLRILYDNWQMSSTLEVNCIEYSSDGRWIVSGEPSNMILWDAETCEPINKLLINGKVISIAFSNDNSKVFCGIDTGDVISCNIDRVESELLVGETIIKQHCPVRSIAVSNNGKMIATGEGFISFGIKDYSVQIWDPLTGCNITQLSGHKGMITSLRFSNDDHILVSSSKDGTMRVWDTRTKECLQVIEALGDANAVAVSFPQFSWLAFCENSSQIVFKETGTDLITAFFSAQVDNIRTHPSGRIWASTADNHLYLLRLEIEVQSKK